MTNKLTGPSTSDTALARDRILFSREQSKSSILDSIFGQNGIYSTLTAKILHFQPTNLWQVGFPPKQTLSKDLCNWFIQEVISGSPESRAGKGRREGRKTVELLMSRSVTVLGRWSFFPWAPLEDSYQELPPPHCEKAGLFIHQLSSVSAQGVLLGV